MAVVEVVAVVTVKQYPCKPLLIPSTPIWSMKTSLRQITGHIRQAHKYKTMGAFNNIRTRERRRGAGRGVTVL